MRLGEILLIDEEPLVRGQLEAALHSSGYSVIPSATTHEGMQKIVDFSPDLILLDLRLPDENGQSFLKKIREWSHTPVIILSTHNREEDVIQALDNGANDYVVKPFRTGELMARIRTALRGKRPSGDEPVLRLNSLEINLAARTVKKDNALVKLTATQYSLLALFGRNVGKVLTHQYLLEEIWGPDYIGQLQYLRVFIAQLRKKIEKDANTPMHIVTESGVGYRFLEGA
jgi:two-component system KDP operon response regulator KdpE